MVLNSECLLKTAEEEDCDQLFTMLTTNFTAQKLKVHSVFLSFDLCLFLYFIQFVLSRDCVSVLRRLQQSV